MGRDLYGGEKALESGLMAGKRKLEGNDAAYDMKSLGKHIEAVSVSGVSLAPVGLVRWLIIIRELTADNS